MKTESQQSTRALQQLVASAIKHAVEEVSFNVTKGRVSLRFVLADRRASELELPISGVELAGAVLERVRFFPALAPSKFKSGLLRTEFSTMVSDCEVRFFLDGPEHSLSRIQFSSFHTDAPDRAGFWLGFDDIVLHQLKEVLSIPTGVVFVWGEGAPRED